MGINCTLLNCPCFTELQYAYSCGLAYISIYICICVCNYFWQVFWRFLCWIYAHNAVKYNILICLKPDVIAKREKMFCKVIWRLHLSCNMRPPSMWYVRPAKSQISLRICAVWSEPFLVARIFNECQATGRTPPGASNLKGRPHRLAQVYTCQNATWLEITCRGQFMPRREKTCLRDPDIVRR